MVEYIEREAILKDYQAICNGVECVRCPIRDKGHCKLEAYIRSIPAADVRPVVVCADCKHNNACLTQAFVEDESKVPFDRNTFFCADGKRADYA